jgi:hypothetical protein
MINLDEDALICDFAETYHVLDMRGLSPKLVAVLAIGLPDSSRIKRRIVNKKLTLEQTLQASILDGIYTLLWSKTKDALKGRNRPSSVLNILEDSKTEKEYKVFTSVEEFERKRAELIGE